MKDVIRMSATLIMLFYACNKAQYAVDGLVQQMSADEDVIQFYYATNQTAESIGITSQAERFRNLISDTTSFHKAGKAYFESRLAFMPNSGHMNFMKALGQRIKTRYNLEKYNDDEFKTLYRRVFTEIKNKFGNTKKLVQKPITGSFKSHRTLDSSESRGCIDWYLVNYYTDSYGYQINVSSTYLFTDCIASGGSTGGGSTDTHSTYLPSPDTLKLQKCYEILHIEENDCDQTVSLETAVATAALVMSGGTGMGAWLLAMAAIFAKHSSCIDTALAKYEVCKK